jgi:4-aminobutyrate aminotransferase-like enzyme
MPMQLVLENREKVAAKSSAEQALYVEHVNPIWVKLLDVLGMNVQYTHASGAELFTSDGRTILDCLSGYCVHNIGHNHPYIISQSLRSCRASLQRCCRAMSSKVQAH